MISDTWHKTKEPNTDLYKKKKEKKKEVMKTNEYFETWALLRDSYISFLTLSKPKFQN